MVINKKDVSVDEAIKYADYEKLLLKRRDNNILLSDYQVSVLNKNGIDYRNFSNVRDLLFEIETCLDDNFNEELDNVSLQLSEFVYYSDTKK